MSPEQGFQLTAASLTLHALELIKPFPITTETKQFQSGNCLSWLKQRQIALLILQFNDGTTGYGELAPLPGFSPESLEQAVAQLQQAVNSLFQNRIQSVGSLDSVVWSGFDQCYPSVQVALQMAFRTRFSPFQGFVSECQSEFFPRVNTATLAKDFDLSTGQIVPENSLINNAQTHQKSDIEEAGTDNDSALASLLKVPDTLKVKVARQTNAMSEELASLDKIVHGNPHLTIRLDANQGWSYQQANSFLRSCQHLPVEFVEEPCRALADNLRLLDEGWPVALDESLQSPLVSVSQFDGLNRPWVACVIKPMLLGGDEQCLPWLDYCRRKQSRIIVSSAFESVLGISYLARLAWQWDPEEIHGLDTLTAFVGDNSYLKWTERLHLFSVSPGPVALEEDIQIGRLLWRI